MCALCTLIPRYSYIDVNEIYSQLNWGFIEKKYFYLIGKCTCNSSRNVIYIYMYLFIYLFIYYKTTG